MPNERFFPIESMDLKISKVPFNDNPKWHDSFTTAHLDLGSPSELPIARSFQYAETKGLPLSYILLKILCPELIAQPFPMRRSLTGMSSFLAGPTIQCLRFLKQFATNRPL